MATPSLLESSFAHEVENPGFTGMLFEMCRVCGLEFADAGTYFSTRTLVCMYCTKPPSFPMEDPGNL